MKSLLYLLMVLSLVSTTPTYVVAQSSSKKIVLCESYEGNTPSGIYSTWDIKKTGGYVYIHYSNGNSTINSSNTLWLYIDKIYDGETDYAAYATESFKVESGSKYAVYDFKFTEEGKYKIAAYQDGKYLATTYATINVIDGDSDDEVTDEDDDYNSDASSLYTTSTNKDATLQLCESVDSYGKPTGVYTTWNITDDANIVTVLYKNGPKKINTENTLYLYVDRKNDKGEYVPYGTENFELKGDKTWAVYEFPFKDAGEYKVQAVQSLQYLATQYITIQKKNSTTTTTTNSTYSTTSKNIVACGKYDTYGKPSEIYDTWNIQKGGGYVYLVYNNAGKKINGTLWLYIDKLDEDNDEYYAYETKTFETDDKSWAAYQFTFTEPGSYKISAVSSKGEEAVTYTTIKFADGVTVEKQKSIVLCDSYDDYGKPIGTHTIWTIPKAGGWIYVLFENGDKITNSVSLYVDKKNTNGKYVAYETKSFDYDNKKSWSVYDFNFKEPGDYKIYAYTGGKELASVYATINLKTEEKTTNTTTTSKYQDDITTWYYETSEVSFAEKSDAYGTMTGKNTTFTVPSTGKELKVVYKHDKPCKTSKIIVDVWTGDDYDDFVETKEFTTNTTQKVIVFPYTFKKAGNYKLSIYNEDETFMNFGEVTIKTGTTTTTTTTSTYTKPSTTTPNYISSSSNKETRTALVIGNGNYVSAGKLPNPAHDAEEMAKALQACGFNVNLLINATKKQMNEAVKQFGLDIMSKKGTGMIFYAGHGIQSKGENYLIPIDAELMTEEDMQYECVNVGQILAKMDAAKNPMNIIVLDACRNNPFERSWSRSQNGNGLASINAPDGTIIAYSTNPGNVASDGQGYNSPYTTAFLTQLKKPNLSIEQVLKGVAGEVKQAMPGQLPWYSSSITGDFYFRP